LRFAGKHCHRKGIDTVGRLGFIKWKKKYFSTGKAERKFLNHGVAETTNCTANFINLYHLNK
jgi:hypothetical protein